MNRSPVFSAVVLAADRGPADPVAAAAGTPCKALVPVGGRLMVLRVLDALAQAREVDRRILCGPPLLAENPEVAALLAAGAVERKESLDTPSRSTASVLAALPETVPVLVTTADHPLLTPEMVDHFCREARASGCDVVAALARYEMVVQALPETRRTVTRLRDGAFCGCNLFAFLTPRGRTAAAFWRKLENLRKTPLRMAAALGGWTVLRYLSGRLSLPAALAHLSRKMGVRAGVVLLPFAEAAVDVDKVEDWRLAEAILARREGGAQASPRGTVSTKAP